MMKRDLNWEKWLKNGDQYLKAATSKGEKSVFNPDIRYNLLSMSLEGYIMAITDYHNKLPFNHTYTDLVRSLARIYPIDAALKAKILKHENILIITDLGDLV